MDRPTDSAPAHRCHRSAVSPTGQDPQFTRAPPWGLRERRISLAHFFLLTCTWRFLALSLSPACLTMNYINGSPCTRPLGQWWELASISSPARSLLIPKGPINRETPSTQIVCPFHTNSVRMLLFPRLVVTPFSCFLGTGLGLSLVRVFPLTRLS